MRSRRRIGPYRVDREIRQGKIGVLYQVRGETGTPRALKVLHAFLIQDRNSLERELQRLIAGLRSQSVPYLLSPIEAGHDPDEDVFYIVYPWVDRALPLDILLQREGGRLTLDRVVTYVWRTLLALRGITTAIGMHGALKLSNLMVDGRGRFYVTDAGLAALIYRTQPGVVPWEAIGTCAYIAPELIQREAMGFPTDLYALAAIAYHLLAGRLPFPYDDPARQRRAHIEEPLPPLEGIPEGFQRWLSQAMAKALEQRFRDPDSALEALENVLLERGWGLSFWLAEAQELWAGGEADLALEHLDRVLRVQPEHPEARLLREEVERSRLQQQVDQALREARQLLDQHRLAEAEERIRWVLTHAPQHAEAVALQARLEELRKRPTALVLWTRSGRAFRLRGEGILGRRSASSPSPDIDLSSEDPQRYVSRRHARIWFANGQWWIQIYPETTNRTWLDGQPLERGSSYPLPDGSSLRIGDLELRVQWILDLGDRAEEV
ncbi:MAG: FHA domain-containing protein [Thermoflexus sp.]|uniref:FHA domain-containing serine/threonine-protein kinase n=1 Tax=Thermoflexus sp. TaxID=1969742 RepID=UPI0025D3B2FF|nr:FHA domain-containing protein [Thermoflexus sp.]MCS6963659.1 FHA domain-containing protein [Thermoflexus sp.]MCS7351020.1 FHA domain-containing protein [Thermoflexus sp.]MDW8180473.1 FHA domain-containing protein [Anaerolineae bacterium]MDW8186005.1 FHA domain-containing protein [Anaerolineae bacterium]